ncbi:MAG: HDIG domain-containing protein [Selenomonas sp.]|uniref:HDIG domain-containing metalloprotein n=1 Tax=Selenomonas sp. TaxID=2053611 RepID=UPI0025E5C0A4|nr:HDIG domain-containing metalloprotein [Selenomonas sp.]MCR5440065.1 HDIG domain-containing protein [Selenomonas sp.]
MIQRVRQLYRALTAHISQEDRAFIDRSIPESAKALFYQMHPADQYHALQVAKTALQLADKSNLTVDRSMLLRCALLHDVGRKKGDLDIWGKVFAVLITHFVPGLAKFIACKEVDSIWRRPGRAIYVYYHHPEIGAAMLRAIGLYEEAAVISRHHQPLAQGDDDLLVILRQADEKN